MKKCYSCDQESPDVQPLVPDKTLAFELMDEKTKSINICDECSDRIDNIIIIPKKEVDYPK